MIRKDNKNFVIKLLLTSFISSRTLSYKGRNTYKLFFLEKEFHLKTLLLLKQQILFTMWLILEKVYIKLLNVFFFLTKCSSFFQTNFL